MALVQQGFERVPIELSFTGRWLDIRTTLKLDQGNVCAHMVSKQTFYINKFSYKIITEDSIQKYSKSAIPWVFN